MAYRLSPVTRASLHDAPPVCVDCVFWQSRSGAAHRQGALGRAARGRLGRLGDALPRRGRTASRLRPVRALGPVPPGVRVARGASVAGCGARHVRVPRRPFLALGAPEPLPRGDRRGARPRSEGDRDLRLPLSGGLDELRAGLVHRTVFPADFLADFGFVATRWEGDVCLARLDLGGLVPVEDKLTARAWRKVKEAFTPAPVPQRP